MKKSILALALVSLLGLGVVGCGPTSDPSTNPSTTAPPWI